MATSSELANRLLTRFKGVPNFGMEDAAELIDDALQVHGLDPSATVPANKINLVLLFAQAEGAWRIAIATAHYFQYTDGEESVNKSGISERYRRLATDLRIQYEAEKAKETGASFYLSQRVDRPNTTPPTGKSGRRRWLN